jgi:hypothetical protein
MITASKAYQGYNSIGNIFVLYSGNLTEQKREQIFEIIKSRGFNLGWVVRDLQVENEDEYGLRGYRHDEGGGRARVEIVDIQKLVKPTGV